MKISKNSILAYNVSIGNIDTVKKLLNEDTDINYQSGMFNDSLLMIAAKQKNIVMLKLLISKGADLNFSDSFGNTALIESSEYNRVEVVKLLIEKGADMTTVNNQNGNFITCAGCKDILRFSTAYVSYHTTANWLCKTSIQRFILSKEPSLYKSLIERGIKISSKIKREFATVISANELNLL